MVRKHIYFYGSVQGVGFRYRSVYKARSLGLTGWVKNCCDGSVEMEVQGVESAIDQLILYLDQQPWIEIAEMKVKSLPPEDHEYDFHEADSDY